MHSRGCSCGPLEGVKKFGGLRCRDFHSRLGFGSVARFMWTIYT